MNNRFKFRVWSNKENKMYKVHSLHLGTNKAIVTSLYGNASIKLDDKILMQSTGLKDKNGKLIYEGDIVKYAEFDWADFSFKDWETEMAEVVWGNTYDNYYPAFDLKQHEFECNGLAYIFNEGWTIEVIGNIYENPELLKECEDE